MIESHYNTCIQTPLLHVKSLCLHESTIIQFRIDLLKRFLFMSQKKNHRLMQYFKI